MNKLTWCGKPGTFEFITVTDSGRALKVVVLLNNYRKNNFGHIDPSKKPKKWTWMVSQRHPDWSMSGFGKYQGEESTKEKAIKAAIERSNKADKDGEE